MSARDLAAQIAEMRARCDAATPAPLGVLRRKAEYRYVDSQNGECVILFGTRNAWSLVWHVASQSERRQIDGFWNSFARMPSFHIERCTKDAIDLEYTGLRAKVPAVAAMAGSGGIFGELQPTSFASTPKPRWGPDPAAQLLSNKYSFRYHDLVSIVSDEARSVINSVIHSHKASK
jgi:hypothetical protein